MLREYEKTVVRILASNVLSPQQIDAVIQEGEFVEYDYTGCGYFLTIKHSILPAERIVCDMPKLTGMAEDILCGFVIFIEDGQLTIECHSWGDVDVPDWFRDREVKVDQI